MQLPAAIEALLRPGLRWFLSLHLATQARERYNGAYVDSIPVGALFVPELPSSKRAVSRALRDDCSLVAELMGARLPAAGCRCLLSNIIILLNDSGVGDFLRRFELDCGRAVGEYVHAQGHPPLFVANVDVDWRTTLRFGVGLMYVRGTFGPYSISRPVGLGLAWFLAACMGDLEAGRRRAWEQRAADPPSDGIFGASRQVRPTLSRSDWFDNIGARWGLAVDVVQRHRGARPELYQCLLATLRSLSGADAEMALLDATVADLLLSDFGSA